MANKKTAVAKTAPAGPLATRPDFIAGGDSRGAQNISKDDLQLPRLALAQLLSPELVDGDPKYIDGLAAGDAFNSLTGEVYGKKPITIVVVRAEKARYVEFVPREEGGGIRDFNVPASDPRCAFGPKGEKPAATKFLEFIVLLPDFGNEPAALSFKGSGLKTARTLNGLIKIQGVRAGNVPAFAFAFTITPTMTQNQLGKFAVFTVRPDGFVDKETFTQAGDFYESIKDREVAPPSKEEPDEDDSEKVPF